MAYGIDPHFHFHVSGISETWEYGLIRSENVRLCQFESPGAGPLTPALVSEQ